MSLRTHAARAGLAATLATLVVTGTAVPRAEAAVDPATLITVAKTAYGAYQTLQSNDDVAAATAKIIKAIDSARSQIIGHIDALATVEAEACARNAVSGLENIAKMNKTTAQLFARDTDKCVNTIYGLTSTLSNKAAIDRAGFALNTVGPIALVAHHNVGFGVSSLKSSLRAANQKVISRLYPSCSAKPLLGDAVPGGMVEVMLRCTAYNGNIGTDTVFTKTPSSTTYNYTVAADKATRNISRALAQAVLPKI